MCNEALKNVGIRKESGVGFIEHLLPKDDWEVMKEIYEKSQLDVIADEGIKVASDIECCMSHFHRINY
ncbi:MAG: hypothetical protein OXH57_03780 [Ekhidna sp.]|nr:hypothetical protein [Ekhidna sp.]